ncbi:MAG TPA: aspartate dehydrogenase [Stellaceae bacterium]|nr:aspartate dehydrogenase [Stellaceae bacterium]
MIDVALIGNGGIAADALRALRALPESSRIRIVGVLARPGRANAARERLGDVPVVEAIEPLIARRPQIIAEVAGQGAVHAFGEAVLENGIDLVVVSIGALAEASLLERLRAAARRGEARLLLPAGAIGGIDAIAAMRLGGLYAVRYRSVKPPAAWRGSPAEKLADLDRLAKRTLLYEGSAREAALGFPQNANVAATVAIAGLGFEATRVELIADPDAQGNIHEIEAEGATGRVAIRLQGKPSATNPKTSALTALSVARTLANAAASIVI